MEGSDLMRKSVDLDDEERRGNADRYIEGDDVDDERDRSDGKDEKRKKKKKKSKDRDRDYEKDRERDRGKDKDRDSHRDKRDDKLKEEKLRDDKRSRVDKSEDVDVEPSKRKRDIPIESDTRERDGPDFDNTADRERDRLPRERDQGDWERSARDRGVDDRDRDYRDSRDYRDRDPYWDDRRRRSPSPGRRRSPDRRDRDNREPYRGDPYRGGGGGGGRSRDPDPRDRDRDYDRRDQDSKYRPRSISRDRRDRRGERRDRSPDRDRDRDRNRDRDRGRDSEKDKEKEKDSEKSEIDKIKPLTLRDIISSNPGISMQEAAQRLNAHNSALAAGQLPPTHLSAAAGGVVAGGAGGASLSAMPAGALPMGVGAVSGEGGALTKPHRELYVGNLPPGVTIPQLAEFLNTVMRQLGLATSPMGSVITAWVSSDGHYAFVEFRTVDEALAAITYLNGMQVGAHALKVGRPKGYNGGASAVAVPMGAVGITPSTMGMGGLGLGLGGATLGGMGMAGVNPLLMGAGIPGALGMGMGGLGGLTGLTTAANASDPPSNVIMVTNMPGAISDEQVRELVGTFGEIKAFNLIKTASGLSQSAVLEYVDLASTEIALQGLKGLEIADFRLAVQRVPVSSASLLLQPTNAAPAQVAATADPAATAGPVVATVASAADSAPADPLADLAPTRVVRLSNMTTPNDLADDELYLELKEDVAEECNKHGQVVSLIIPRGESFGGAAEDAAAVGFIFVHFTDIEGASAARKAVAGRSFNGLTVRAVFFPEDLFFNETLVVPADYFEIKEAAREEEFNKTADQAVDESAGGEANEGDEEDIKTPADADADADTAAAAEDIEAKPANADMD